jgi:sodium/potassium/calcium exchanger 6
MSTATCTHDSIFGPNAQYKLPADQCTHYGKGVCAKEEDMINFYAVHFCMMNGSNFGLICFGLIFITFNFRWLSILIDEYLAEGITRISSWLGFSEALAAVTLLAFANGAGDVFTALVASGTENGVFYNIGSLYGAGLFCCCVVVAGAIFMSSEPVKFDKMIIFRDISFYIVATLCIIVFGIHGRINLLSAFILLGLYVA